MAKHLVFDYDFDASEKTVTLDGIYAKKRLLLITNMNDNEIIYSFTDPSKGLSDISFDYTNYTTTLTLTYDTTAMADTDPLQVFVEADNQTFKPSDTFTDPVSKFRVSQPENLIDTDFEYGLQSTKWETLELTKNIPTFFARNGDETLELSDITAINGSDVITVTTAAPHGFQRGSPIIMVGTSTVTADGGFVVSSVPSDTTFTYKCKATQTVTTSILETYTQLFPGSVYSGTEFKLRNVGGIVTDAASPSTLTVTTEYPTNFTAGTSLSLANTYASGEVSFNTSTQVQPDNFQNDSQSYTNNSSTGETIPFALGGLYPWDFTPNTTAIVYFEEGTVTVDTGANTIEFAEPHGFTSGQMVAYLGDGTTNTPIGGLTYNKAYWVVAVDSTTIRLYTDVTLSTIKSLTSNGVSGGITKSAFAKGENAYLTSTTDYFYFRAAHPFTGSQANNRFIIIDADGYATQSNTTPWITPLNPVENYDYFGINIASTRIRVAASSTGAYLQLSSQSTEFLCLPINVSNNFLADTAYLPNHGFPLATQSPATITATAGTLPTSLATAAFVYPLSADRVRFAGGNGSFLGMNSFGSTDLVYQVNVITQLIDADTITVTGNTFQDGDPVTYDVNGGTEIGGLTDGSTYYVARKTGDRFNLSTAKQALVSSQTLLQNSSTYVSTASDYVQFTSAHGLTTGDCVEYTSSTPIGGLLSGYLYFVRAISVVRISFHPTAADAAANTNTVQLLNVPGGTGTVSKYDIIDLSSSPSGETQKFVTNFIGAADGIYSIASTAANKLSFTMESANQINPRIFTVESQDMFTASLDGFYYEDHGFSTGEAAVVTLTGTTGITGLTSGNTYYLIATSKDVFQFAASESDALAGTAITLTDTASATARTGTVDVSVSAITGRFAGSGTVSYEASSTTVIGDGTKFTSYFNAGDLFDINIPPTTATVAITSVTTNVLTATGINVTAGDTIYFTGTVAPSGLSFETLYFARPTTVNTFTVHYTEADAVANTNIIAVTTIGTSASVTKITDAGGNIQREIEYVNSDSQITLTEALPATAQADVNYYLNTTLLMRSDGFALHRPYDGGVDLIPSTNPDSQMIRQTRKYFRYQSGKGIQVSFAVNFSPTSQIDGFSRSGNVGTITTRFPHRLTAGLTIVTSGSTNTSLDTIGTKTYDVVVATDGLGNPYFSTADGAFVDGITMYEGRTYRFDQSDSSNATYQLLFSTTPDGDNDGGSEYTTGVTKAGTPGSSGAYTEITVASGAPTLYAYKSGTANMGFEALTPTDPQNGIANLWNGELTVLSIVDDSTFTVQLQGTPSDSEASGVVEYYVKSWARSALRCGLFDDQNGIFFEYDGEYIYACRRSSIQQISGYCSVTFRSGEVNGVSTNFLTQLSVDEPVVIKGQTYLVTKIDSDTRFYITPSYRGATADKVIITKTATTKVRQDEWNIDPCDGTGPSGFDLNLYRIQMAYIDYAWYGAGKVRFGFKDQNGDVFYCHQFVHGNFFTEAYMRSGNLPARYELQNIGAPTYVPALAHWGTSVIMDGRFDDDKAYVFNATSNNLTLTGSASVTASGKIDYLGIYTQRLNRNNYSVGYAVLLDAPSTVLNSVTAGATVSGAGLAANTLARNPLSTFVTPYQPYLPEIVSREGTDVATQDIRSLLVLDKAPTTIAVSSSTYTISVPGAAVAVTKDIPLISIRLAPSVDTSTPGFLGEREIINRMQLILNSVGILTTHTAEIKLVLNGQLNSNNWQRVNNPSLSQLLVHTNEDTIIGGSSVYNFRAAGDTGTSGRSQQLTTEALGEVATLGNAIMGGNNTFPDGPDVLTVVASLTEDPSTVSTSNPFVVSGRISWAESQA